MSSICVSFELEFQFEYIRRYYEPDFDPRIVLFFLYTAKQMFQNGDVKAWLEWEC